jgi:hypothetical protein
MLLSSDDEDVIAPMTNLAKQLGLTNETLQQLRAAYGRGVVFLPLKHVSTLVETGDLLPGAGDSLVGPVNVFHLVRLAARNRLCLQKANSQEWIMGWNAAGPILSGPR